MFYFVVVNHSTCRYEQFYKLSFPPKERTSQTICRHLRELIYASIVAMEENWTFLNLQLSSFNSEDPVKKFKTRNQVPIRFDTMSRIIISSASFSSMGKLLRSTLFWIGFMLFGWYFPRSLVHRETSILSLQPPYQLSGETVIVDFELNQPLVDPPTIDGEFFLSPCPSCYVSAKSID